jgi:hypothetical protein
VGENFQRMYWKFDVTKIQLISEEMFWSGVAIYEKFASQKA